jgi:hypothetical protein
MTDDLTIELDGGTYVLRHEGTSFQVGRQTDGDVAWLETVDGGLLSEDARAALDEGDPSDEALLTVVRGIVTAEVERGG